MVSKVVDYDEARLHAAEEVCWTLLLMIELNALELPMEWRNFLGQPLGQWSNFGFDKDYDAVVD